MCFSIAILPDTPMIPRANDARLSFFTVDYQDLGVHKQKKHPQKPHWQRNLGHPEKPSRLDAAGKHVDTPVSVIWRYNLDVLPNKQIRICIDPTVPERWREAFRQGIERWNDAFDSIGYPNAVHAVAPSDKDWPEDYDAGDVRFNTISWSLSDEVVSMGIAKVDPRSGQVIKSDIIMSDGWVAAWLDDLTRMAPQLVKQKTTQKGRGYRREEMVLTNIKATLRPLHEKPPAHLASHMSQDTWQEIVADGLADVVTHEVGHILGLRHNFKGSMGVSYECTQNMACSAIHGLSASVMDYVPMNLPTVGSDKKVHIFSPVVGEYDKAAIAYGYTKLDESAVEVTNAPPTAPHQLDSLLETAGGYPFCMDEEYDAGLDPLCDAYDFSSDPLTYYTDQLDRVVDLQKMLLNNSVASGDPYWNYGSSAASLWYLVEGIGSKLSFWIGGANTSYEHRGIDGSNGGRLATQAIPAAQQLLALQLLLKTLRPQAAGLLPPQDTMNFLVTQDYYDGVKSLDLTSLVREAQKSLVTSVIKNQTLLRLERMSGLNGLTVADFLKEISQSVFNLNTQTSEDWDLQQLVAEKLASLLDGGSLPASVAAQVSMSVADIRDQVGASLKGIDDEQQLLAVHLRQVHTVLAVDKSSASASTFKWFVVALSILPTLGLTIFDCI
jgi:hypothetical protein